MSPALFENIPQEDYFNLFTGGGEPDGKKVVEFLKYKKEDVSVATGVPLKSIRYDLRMPAELRERLTEWATAINLVGNYFEDLNKTVLWLHTSNPLLGNMSPRNMIRLGRFKKLLKFIQSALDENIRHVSK
jgi:hypothetical protein